MKIPVKEYSIESFTDELMSLYLAPSQRLKIVCFMTEFSEWYEFPNSTLNLNSIFSNFGATIEKLGEIRKIQTKYTDNKSGDLTKAVFYAYLDPLTKLLVCFTTEKAKVIEKTLGKIAETSSGLYYVFISTRTFDVIQKKIFETDPKSKCWHFVGKYLPHLMKKSQIRPSLGRTVMYYGDDGLESLKEFREKYGTIPVLMSFNIPDIGNYEISSIGIFSLWADDSKPESRKLLMDLSNIAIHDILESRKIIESSKYETIPIKTETKVFNVQKVTPWVMRFSDQIEFIDSDSLLEAMNENGFSLFNEVRLKGSLRLDGMVIDDNKKTMFSIDADDRQIRIAPIEKISFDSFMRFYRTILENFDPNVKLEQFEG